MTTNLPSADVVRAEQTMTIKQIVVSQLPNDVVETTIMIRDGRGNYSPAIVRLYKIDEQLTGGAVPAKSWSNGASVVLAFYVTPVMPMHHRPFAGGKTYIAVLPNVGPHADVTYPIGSDGPSLLIDQVVYEGKCSYVFLFGESEYDKVVVREIK